MTGPTKILTVSYGTFSCTLEGFDDPLGSMREMAEYFRDLAADDRYFGAEPPTPDVEMLQRIAEKEVQRRVEARVSESGVALVAAPEPAPAPEPEAPAEASAQPTTRVEETGPLAYDDDYLMSDEPEDVLSIDPSATLETAGPAESVAEKLRRIRAVVSRNIEIDKESARREQAPNAENPDLRDRALSETISQIQADLADDEGSPTAVPPAETDAEAESWDQDRESDAEISATEDMVVAEAAAETLETPAAPDTEEPEQEQVESRQDRSLTEMIGSVAERVSQSDDTEDGVPGEPVERDTSRTLSPEPEADVGRLLDETDSKLNDNETVRRRRVISQMRAAVAATKADRLVSQHVSREVQEEAEKDPYRADLSDAVQDEPSSDTEAQATTAPPLVLVSSQRIDSELTDAGADAAEFAARFGAKELPELMEAAAAFAIFSEGQPSFTRPEIMQMVTRMDPSLHLSREESLRSFGQLLREGTFKKLERGQFTIDHATKYNPEDRAAGA